MNENIKAEVVEETTEFLQVPVAKVQNGVINCDFVAFKSAIKAKVEDYKLMKLNNDNYKEIADAKAGINKAMDALKKHRTAIKKDFLKPFEEYNKNVDDCLDVMLEGRDSLQVQLEDYNEKQDEEKKAKILTYYNKLCDQTQFKFVKLEQIWNKKWLNKTCTGKDVAKDINNSLDAINNAITVLSQYDDKQMLIAEFLQKVNYDNLQNNQLLSSMVLSYTERKRRIEEIERERQAQQPVVKENIEVVKINDANIIAEPIKPQVKDNTGELKSIALTIRNINKEKTLALSQFLKDNNIDYDLKLLEDK